MKDFIAEVISAGLKNPWMVIDNASCHASPKMRRKNIVKATTKKQLAEDEIDRLPGETLLAFRFRKVQETI